MLKKYIFPIAILLLVVLFLYIFIQMFKCAPGITGGWFSCAASNLTGDGNFSLFLSLIQVFILSFFIILFTAYILDKYSKNTSFRKFLKGFGQFIVIFVGGLSVIIFAFEKQDPVLDKNIQNITSTLETNIEKLSTANKAYITDNCKIKFAISEGKLSPNEASKKKMTTCSYHVYLEEMIDSVRDLKQLSVTDKLSHQKSLSLINLTEKKLINAYSAHKTYDEKAIKETLKGNFESIIFNLNGLVGMQIKSIEDQAFSSLLITFVFALIFATVLELILTFYRRIIGTVKNIVKFLSKITSSFNTKADTPQPEYDKKP